MQPPDALLQPLIGFALWHLERGWTIDATREAMQSAARKRGWPTDKFDEAIRWAIIVQGATARANEALAVAQRRQQHGP